MTYNALLINYMIQVIQLSLNIYISKLKQVHFGPTGRKDWKIPYFGAFSRKSWKSALFDLLTYI